MYTLIKSNIDLILNSPNIFNDIQQYLPIIRLFPQIDVSNDGNFQKIYRKYWRLNAARLQQTFFEVYFDLLEKWYGKKVSSLCNDLMKQGTMPWECEVVTDLPLFEELIQYADACIVHSEFERKSVNKALPDLSVYKLAQVYEGMEIIEKKYDPSEKKLKIKIVSIFQGRGQK